MSPFFALLPGGWSRPVALLALTLPWLTACHQDVYTPAPWPLAAYGPPVSIGAGVGRSFVVAGAGGQPIEIGLALTETALTGLPALPATGTMYDLALPGNNAAAARLPFDHLSVGWNPNGHDPLPIYGAPHFDVHFYLQTMAAQHTIALDDPKGDIFPAAAKLPADYVTAPNVAPGRTVPMMGRHWVDATSPEYAPGGTFSHTFVYGTYDGHVTFMEPMLTRALLVPAVSVDQAIKQPASYEVTGKYFPSRYTIRYDGTAKEYLITLREMTLR